MQALYPGETVLRPKKKFAGSSGALPLVSANTISTAIYGLLLVGLPNGRFSLSQAWLLWLNLRSIIAANSS
jgi:hypothetical protein